MRNTAEDQERSRRAELYSHEIDWWLTQRDAMCGVRSTLGGQVMALERGGAGGFPNSDPYHDGQVGMGRWAVAAFDLDRLIRPRWFALDKESQNVLMVYYFGRSQGSDGDDHGKDFKTHGYTNRSKFPPGVEAVFGQFASMAMFFDAPAARDLGTRASGSPSIEIRHRVEKLLARSENAVRKAHRAYYAIRNNTDDADVIPIDAAERPGWRADFERMRKRRRFADGAFDAESESFADMPRRDKDGVWRQ